MRWVMAALLFPAMAQAESVVTTRAVEARAILSVEDLTTVAAEIPGAVSSPAEAVGKQTRRRIEPGRPVLGADLLQPMAVSRNARVLMRFDAGGLQITAEGRALQEGAVGAVIRVMSLSSRTIVPARIAPDGSVLVEDRACAGC